MVSFNDVQAQLMRHDSHFRFIGIAELKQLAMALEPGEQIMDCLKGWYGGGISVLCATDRRLVIVDKNTTKTSVLQVSYEIIEKIKHIDRGWSSVLHVSVPGKNYEFLSWHIKRLKQLHQFMQRHTDYVKTQANNDSEMVDMVRFQTPIRPKNTSRNWAVFAQRIGNSSLS